LEHTIRERYELYCDSEMSEVLGNIEINRFVNVEVRGPQGKLKGHQGLPANTSTVCTVAYEYRIYSKSSSFLP
jgi:hypothetical protein